MLKEKAKSTRERTRRERMRILETELLPAWENRPAGSVTGSEVRQLIRGIGNRGTPTMANRTLALVRLIYNEALTDEFPGVEGNPGARLKNLEEGRRSRFLNRDEIKVVCNTLEAESPTTEGVFRLAMLTAQRIGSMCARASLSSGVPPRMTLETSRSITRERKTFPRTLFHPLGYTLADMPCGDPPFATLGYVRVRGSDPVLILQAVRLALRNPEGSRRTGTRAERAVSFISVLFRVPSTSTLYVRDPIGRRAIGMDGIGAHRLGSWAGADSERHSWRHSS